MHDLVAIQTPHGVTWVSPDYYLRTLGTTHNLGAVDPGQGIVAAAGAGAALAQSLLAAGVASQALPVVGQILGGIALIGGYIVAARAKAKAVKDQATQVDAATVELLQQNSTLDTMLATGQSKLAEIKAEINRLGLSGTALGGFADWLSKTFTPARYEQNILNDKTATYNNLLQQVENKIGMLQQMETELKRLYDQLTGGKTLQRTLLIGGSVALGLTALYLLNQKYKWIKV